MPKVMTTSLNADDAPHIEILRGKGFEVAVAPADLNRQDGDSLVRLLADCDAVVAGAEPYPRPVIESLPKLRAIVRSGVGYDAIDLAACDDAGIVVATTPGVNHHAVAEHTMAMLMAVSRGFADLDRRVREGRWKRIAYPRVMGRTLGILGLGRIGRAVATRAIGLGMDVLAFEPYPNKEFVEQWKIELTGFDDLLARSDYVSLHLPMSAENYHLMNTENLAKMKAGSVLINTARGGLVNEEAVCAALESGRLRAAALDVFNVEPLPLDSPLLKFDNVLLSGHVAGLDVESHRDTFVMVAEIILELAGGGWPAECIQNLKGAAGWKWNRG